MEAVKVPQNLDLKDVLVWGLGAMDLLCLGVGGVCGWWLYMAIRAPLVVRVGSASPMIAIGLLLGLGKVAGRPLREWLVVVAGYLQRSRRHLYAGEL
jgi:hypothetical protein